MSAKGTDANKNYGSFTNSAGETFVIHGLSPLLPQKMMDAVKAEWLRDGKQLPIVPTYVVTLAGGDTEVHEHDASTLVVEGDEKLTKINQDNWREYSRLSTSLEAEYNTRLMKAVLLAVQVTPTQEWRDEMDFMGVGRPTEKSPAEKYAFVETKVIQSALDLSKLMSAVFRLAGIISEEAIAEVDATFQRSMEEAFAEAGKSGGKKQ